MTKIKKLNTKARAQLYTLANTLPTFKPGILQFIKALDESTDQILKDLLKPTGKQTINKRRAR